MSGLLKMPWFFEWIGSWSDCCWSGLVPGVGWFLQWTGSCSGLLLEETVVPRVDWFLKWAGSLSGLVPGVDWFLQWTVAGVDWFLESHALRLHFYTKYT